MLLIFEGDRVFFVLIDIHSLAVFVGNGLYDECEICVFSHTSFTDQRLEFAVNRTKALVSSGIFLRKTILFARLLTVKASVTSP